MYQCGVPREMAIELFKTVCYAGNCCSDYAQNVKAAKRMVERGDERIWDVWKMLSVEHPKFQPRTDLHRLKRRTKTV